MSQLAVFTNASAVVAYSDKKGNAHNITPEGALFKGGNALKALKDQALTSAYEKAAIGRYRQAADIIGAAFGSITKSFERVIGTPWANKSAMVSYLLAVDRVEEPAKGWSQKQKAARTLMAEIRHLPAFADIKPEAVTIDME